MSNITFADKVAMEEHPEIPRINKVTAADMNEIKTAVNSKQDTLESGTSIKTINNTSLLGSGDIAVGGVVHDTYSASTSEAYSCNYVNNINKNVINNTNAINELKSPGPDNYIDEYEYVVGDIVIHDGKRYRCIKNVEEYTWWEDQKSVTEMTNNANMISFIDEQFFINQIQMLWPDFEGGSSQAITVYLDEQGPVTLTCPGLDDREQTFSSIETLKNAQGIYVEPYYSEQSCSFVVNLDACWAWIPSGDLYSTQETDTGKVWIDGKRIYRKVLSFTIVNSTGETKTVAHNILNLDKIIHMEMIVKNEDGYFLSVESSTYSSSAAAGFNISWLRINNTNLIYQLGGTSKLANQPAWAILEYTKS